MLTLGGSYSNNVDFAINGSGIINSTSKCLNF